MSPRRAGALGRRRALLAATVVGVIGIGLAVVLATRSPDSGVDADSPLVGEPAPNFSGIALVGGERVSLAAERGRVVLVDFFASWCGPCQSEAPTLEAFVYDQAKAERVAFIGVDIADTAANGKAFLRQTGATWPAIEDPSGSGSVALAYGVDSPPEIFAISPTGIVTQRLVGPATPGLLEHLVASARALR